MKMKTMRIILSALLAVVLCLFVTACGDGDRDDTPSPERDGTAASNTTTTVVTEEGTVVPEQELCWTCGKLPVVGNTVYCYNCKCMLCDSGRKFGGDYVFCMHHNCNENLCTAQRVDGSQYCVVHKCSAPNCNNKRWSGSEYCSMHK